LRRETAAFREAGTATCVDLDQGLILNKLVVLVVLASLLGRANDLALDVGNGNDMAVVTCPAADLKVDGLTFVLLQQPILCDDGGIVVLLDDVEGAFRGGIAEGWISQDDGIGFELGGDLVGGDFIQARMEIEIDLGAGNGEVLVIDGQRRRRG